MISRVMKRNPTGAAKKKSQPRLVQRLDGDTIATARIRQGMTQTQLAQKCGLSLYTIFKAEKGRGLYPGTGETICAKLGLKLEEVSIPVRAGEQGDAA